VAGGWLDDPKLARKDRERVGGRKWVIIGSPYSRTTDFERSDATSPVELKIPYQYCHYLENFLTGLVFLKTITICSIRNKSTRNTLMSSHTANITSTFKKWSVAHLNRSNDSDRQAIATPIALPEPAPQDLTRSAEAEHRASFS